MARLRKRKDRKGRYVLDYTDSDGRRYQIDTGTKNESTAKRWWLKYEERLLQVESGEIEKIGRITADDIEGLRVKTHKTYKTRLRLSEYQTLYEKRGTIELNLSAKTLELNILGFKSFKDYVGDVFIDEIDAETVRKWRDNMRENGYAKTTESMYGRSLKASFQRAVQWKYLEHNPFSEVRMPSSKETRRTDKTMKMSEVMTILKLIDKEISEKKLTKQYKDCIQCLLFSGARAGEIVSLRGEDVDLEKRIITLTVTKKRGGPVRERRPITQSLYDVLVNMDIVEGEYLFKTNASNKKLRESKRNWTRQYITTRFKKLIRAAKLSENYTLHSLRKTYVNHLHEQGVPIDIIARLVGHSSSQITWLDYDTTDALSFKDFAEKMTLPLESEQEDQTSQNGRNEEPPTDTNTDH